MKKLIITYEAAEKIRQYTALCPDEISGIGKVVVEKDDLVVTDVEIFKQVVSGSHSTIAPESLAEFQSDIVKAGGSMKQYLLWWHSHAHMGVFFSNTDTDTIETSTEFPYLVSLVVNKKGEAKARLDYYTPLHGTVDLTVEVETAPVSKNAEEIMEQIDELTERLAEETKKGSAKIKELCQKEIDKKVGKKDWSSDWNHKKWGDKSDKKTERDWEIDLRADYWKEKTSLLEQVKYLSEHGGSKGLPLLETKQSELESHIQYGKSMGYEIQKDLIIKDK